MNARSVTLLLSCLVAASSLACGHAQVKCPRPAAAAMCPSASVPAAFGFADRAAFDTPEPLALYDVKWQILTGDSGASSEPPPALHSFTLGRWECALSAEKIEDSLQTRAQVKRSRKLVCTHATGLTMQTEVACSLTMPAAPSEGSPRLGHREARVALGDAPSVTLSCEPSAVERLVLLKSDRTELAQVCLQGQVVAACMAP